MIYFDNAGSTKVDDRVLDEFILDNKKYYANPSSSHFLGLELSNKIEKIKKEILESLSLSYTLYDVIFTSGTTESNNLAIKGYVEANKSRGNHLITSKIEHPSVLNVFKKLEEEGYQVTYLDVDIDGNIDLETLKKVVSKNTILVSLMGVNNETGTILNLKSVKEIIKNYPKIVFHSDLAQVVGKIDFDFKLCDLLSISGYKVYGIKGIGCLIKQKKINLKPQIIGGEQQNDLRSGTLPYPLIASLGNAIKLAKVEKKKCYETVLKIHDYLVSELSRIEEIKVNLGKNFSPYILNFSLLHKKASVVSEALSNKEIYVSTKSSCESKINESSYVIYEFNHNEKDARNSIRLSFSKYNTLEEAETFIKELKLVLSQIKDE